MGVYREKQIARIRESCAIVREVLGILSLAVEPGISTLELDAVAEEHIKKLGGRPAFKGYRGYPGSICASLNEQVVHGIPDSRTILKEGDILGIDIGVELGGFYGDAAATIPAGKVSAAAGRLIEATRNALARGIEKAVAGNRLHDISAAVQSCVEARGFSVVRNFVGHGIGANLHEEPAVPNFGRPGTGAKLVPGMVIALEPMVNEGSFEVRVEKDNWTAVTADGKLSAHFEHTIAITSGKPEVLTA